MMIVSHSNQRRRKVARSTTIRPQAPRSSEARRAKRIRLILDRSRDDKSTAYLRDRCSDHELEYDMGAHREKRIREGFADDWDTTDYRQLNGFGETPEEFMARCEREWAAFNDLMLREFEPREQVSPRPQHSAYQKDQAVALASTKPAMSLEQLVFNQQRRELNRGLGLRQFA
jgi:hypothetical protein